MKVKYRGIPYISPWAYTLVAVFRGLVHGDGIIHQGFIHGGFLSVIIMADLLLFSQIIMYFNDFWATWAYTRGRGLIYGY